jgi:hypothetical protein
MLFPSFLIFHPPQINRTNINEIMFDHFFLYDVKMVLIRDSVNNEGKDGKKKTWLRRECSAAAGDEKKECVWKTENHMLLTERTSSPSPYCWNIYGNGWIKVSLIRNTDFRENDVQVHIFMYLEGETVHHFPMLSCVLRQNRWRFV